jgi:hypothetical protein
MSSDGSLGVAVRERKKRRRVCRVAQGANLNDEPGGDQKFGGRRNLVGGQSGEMVGNVRPGVS